VTVMIKKPFHELVAEKIIDQLKKGTAPWQKPWEPGRVGALIPTNPITQKRYKGINALHLMAQGYTDTRWMTYKQANTLDAQVTKGEKGTAIQYWKFTDEQIKKDEIGVPVLNAQGEPIKIEVRLERPYVFYAVVFNAEQIEGLPPLLLKEPVWNANERAEQILVGSGARIIHAETDRAFYRPASDSIHLPHKDQFLNADFYYATALHELGHWTGHSSRLDRDLIHPFGSEGYAREELRAEIVSMILSDEVGIGHDSSQHCAYVASWIKVLQDDPMELFRAASDAEKIQHYLFSLEQSHELKLEQWQQLESSIMNNESIDLPTQSTETVHNFATLISSFNPKTLEEDIKGLQDEHLKNSHDRIWLDIPFKQKEVAKQMAGTLPNGQCAIAWDKQVLRWYAHPEADLNQLKPWIPNNQETQQEIREPALGEGTIAVEKTWLVVPYEQRETVKALAGRLPDGGKAVEWDKNQKSWYASPGANLDKLKPWIAQENSVRQQPGITPEQEFSDVLRSMGCLVTGDHPIMDGKKHRIQCEGDKKGEKAGFYVGYLDGCPAGYVKNNRTGSETRWKCKGYVLSAEDKTILQSEAREKIQKRAEEIALLQEKAALRVNKIIKSLLSIHSPTPYLESKGIPIQSGIYTNKDNTTTCIPATDINGKVWSMQFIQEDGTKRFARDSKKEGCFHVLGGLDALHQVPVITIAEGYATSATIKQVLELPTVCAFDAGNLKEVAIALHQKYPNKPILIIGDDDKQCELNYGVNPGKVFAEEAAKAVNGTAIFPIFAPGEQGMNPKEFSDFNDLATKSILGLEGVKRQLLPKIEAQTMRHQETVPELQIKKQMKQHHSASL